MRDPDSGCTGARIRQKYTRQTKQEVWKAAKELMRKEKNTPLLATKYKVQITGFKACKRKLHKGSLSSMFLKYPILLFAETIRIVAMQAESKGMARPLQQISFVTIPIYITDLEGVFKLCKIY